MYLLSLILGIIPDVTIFTLCLIYFKEMKNKKKNIILFLGLLITNIVLALLLKYNILVYMFFTIIGYMILKGLYKDTKSIDVFLFVFIYVLLTITSFCSLPLIKINYWLSYIVQRSILIILIVILKKKFNNFYLKYRASWDINDNSKIKSIKLRNISLSLCYTLLFVINIGITNIKI